MNSITVRWPARALSPNVTASWQRKHAARKAAKKEAYVLAFNHEKITSTEPLRVKLDAYPKHIRKRDHDNLLASLKGHLDGLALALGVDDNLFRPELTIHPADGTGRIVMTVEAL